MSVRYRDGVLILFCVGILAFNYPLLALFDKALTILGIPLLVLYLYGFWLSLVVVLALWLRAAARQDGSGDD